MGSENIIKINDFQARLRRPRKGKIHKLAATG
jgi:hypothetical protein